MDLKGSLVDTCIKIFPTDKLVDFLQTLPVDDKVPTNILKLAKGKEFELDETNKVDFDPVSVSFTNKDIEHLKAIRDAVKDSIKTTKTGTDTKLIKGDGDKLTKEELNEDCPKEDSEDVRKDQKSPTQEGPYLTTSDIDWLYIHLQKRRKVEKVPYLHVLLEGAHIEMPENKVLKRNPVLEARCVKLRAQQEARDYRNMTKGVDNVRLRFPEDSISYQMKQMNRQMIAVGQFLLSIFAGFLFGFKGVEWMVGPLDFGFKLLLGVMCALVIALAEIYFLAKKLNEELSIPETVQLGGPPKFADQKLNGYTSKKGGDKEHQD